MRPRAIAAALRFAAHREWLVQLPDVPLYVCPPCCSSHGSTPLTPAVARQHGRTTLTRFELEVASDLLAEVREGRSLAATLSALARVDEGELATLDAGDEDLEARAS